MTMKKDDEIWTASRQSGLDRFQKESNPAENWLGWKIMKSPREYVLERRAAGVADTSIREELAALNQTIRGKATNRPKLDSLSLAKAFITDEDIEQGKRDAEVLRRLIEKEKEAGEYYSTRFTHD